MPMIDDLYLQALRNCGLHVCKPFPEGHAWAHGVRVGKPKTLAGNKIFNYEIWFDGVAMDAPSVVLYFNGKKWIIAAQDYIPTPGPGDFHAQWDFPEEAVNDIWDFYFGDPTRMAKKATAYLGTIKRVAEYRSYL